MQLDPRITWWLGFALAAVQGLTTVSWNTLGLDPKWIALVSQVDGYLAYLLIFALHGSVPGVAATDLTKKAAAAVLAIGVTLAVLGWSSPAHAQNRTPARAAPGPALTGDPVKDIGNAIKGGGQQGGGAEKQSPLDELAAKIRKLGLDDFKYAAALAHATGNTVAAPCWDEWVKLLTAQQQPLNGPGDPIFNPDGTPQTGADGKPVLGPAKPLKEPDPHLATDIERLSEMVAQMQPRSELSVACAPLANTVQKDAATLIGAVLSGGAMGLFKLPFAIP